MDKKNSLADLNPNLAAEWHPTKNKELKPKDVTPKSGKKVWWQCQKGHEWSSKVCHRSDGHGCPYCTGQRVLPGENDLATINPDLAKEWHPTKNPGITPKDVTANTHRKVWWLCGICGHEWQTAISDRNRGNGCPKCNARFQTSFPEQAVYFYIKQFFPNVINRDTQTLGGIELDIYIPSEKTAIEYDGIRFHRNKQKQEAHKYSKCKEAGIKLIRIKESDSKSLTSKALENCDVFYTVAPHLSDFNSVFSQLLFDHFNIETEIDIQKDNLKIKESYYSFIRDNSLAVVNPRLAKEWNYERNGNLTPEMFSRASGDKVWWKCSTCGHEWPSTINNRNKGQGCPACANRTVMPGYNDLTTINPKLAKEWNYKRNGNLKPQDFTSCSHKKVWWICYKGHEWSATIKNRNKGRGCPYCSNKRILIGYNDLATTNPELAKQWHPKKNGDLKPTDFSHGSNQKIWWKCPVCGHEWLASIAKRSSGRGCPECAIKRQEAADI